MTVHGETRLIGHLWLWENEAWTARIYMKDHVRMLKIMQSMSEFGGLWKHKHNQHTLVPPKMECGCPSGGGIKNVHIHNPSYGGTQKKNCPCWPSCRPCWGSGILDENHVLMTAEISLQQSTLPGRSVTHTAISSDLTFPLASFTFWKNTHTIAHIYIYRFRKFVNY